MPTPGARTSHLRSGYASGKRQALQSYTCLSGCNHQRPMPRDMMMLQTCLGHLRDGFIVASSFGSLAAEKEECHFLFSDMILLKTLGRTLILHVGAAEALANLFSKTRFSGLSDGSDSEQAPWAGKGCPPYLRVMILDIIMFTMNSKSGILLRR